MYQGCRHWRSASIGISPGSSLRCIPEAPGSTLALVPVVPGMLALLAGGVRVLVVHALRGAVGLARQQPRSEADNLQEGADAEDQHGGDKDVHPPHFDRLQSSLTARTGLPSSA